MAPAPSRTERSNEVRILLWLVIGLIVCGWSLIVVVKFWSEQD